MYMYFLEIFLIVVLFWPLSIKPWYNGKKHPNNLQWENNFLLPYVRIFQNQSLYKYLQN